MLSQSAAQDLVRKQLFPAWENERQRLDRIDRWYRWEQDPIRLPRKATPELRLLAELSQVPWLGLVVTATAQAMYVDGFRSADDGVDDASTSSPWRTWQANDFDHRQIAVHRATLAYGYSFVTVLPGENFLGEQQAVMRGVSPRKMWAAYDDPAEDDWPTYAIRVDRAPGDSGTYLVRLYDDKAVYRLRVEADGPTVSYLSEDTHGVGVCPVVRYCNDLDLDGRTPGEVEPFIPLAARINKTAYDRMLTQHFNSWKVRTVAGMAEPDDVETANRKKLQLRQDDILVAEDADTKFGSLPETPLAGFIDAHTADVETLAAVTQTPTHELTGKMANLSAEALAAARASLTQKVTQRQKSCGKGHAQALRLAAGIDGDEAHARDVYSRVTWQDMQIRSMAQAVDALGKASTMLGVPPTALWSRIPGVEKSDVDEWIGLAERGDPITRMQQELERQSQAASSRPPRDSSDTARELAGDGRF